MLPIYVETLHVALRQSGKRNAARPNPGGPHKAGRKSTVRKNAIQQCSSARWRLTRKTPRHRCGADTPVRQSHGPTKNSPAL